MLVDWQFFSNFYLHCTGSTFQRLLDRVLAGLAFAFVYLDDIIIASSSMEQHQQDVEEVFWRLQSAGLVINFEKCTFAVPEVDFLGHRVSARVCPSSQQSGRHPEVSAAGDGFQLLPAVCAGSGKDPKASHRLYVGQPQGDSGGRVDTVDGGGFRRRQDRFRSGRVAGAPAARPGVGGDGGCFRRPCRRGPAAAALAGGGLAAARFFL